MNLDRYNKPFTACGVSENGTLLFFYFEKVDFELTKKAFEIIYDGATCHFFHGHVQSVENVKADDFAKAVVSALEFLDSRLHRAEKILNKPDVTAVSAENARDIKEVCGPRAEKLREYLTAYKS